MQQCHEYLRELMYGVNPEGATIKQPATKLKPNRYRNDVKLRTVMQELEEQLHQPGEFVIHPKMSQMRALLVEHFVQKTSEREDAQASGGDEHHSGDSRVMVFASYRTCVNEIVAVLEHEKPLIRAVPFIGRATDKSGRKGYSQKEQLEVCANVLIIRSSLCLYRSGYQTL